VDISQALYFTFRQMKGNETHKRDFSNYFFLSKTIKKGAGALRLQKRTVFAVDYCIHVRPNIPDALIVAQLLKIFITASTRYSN
jgi:hypothetical protein